jgi:hypothetical protein
MSQSHPWNDIQDDRPFVQSFLIFASKWANHAVWESTLKPSALLNARCLTGDFSELTRHFVPFLPGITAFTRVNQMVYFYNWEPLAQPNFPVFLPWLDTMTIERSSLWFTCSSFHIIAIIRRYKDITLVIQLWKGGWGFRCFKYAV